MSASTSFPAVSAAVTLPNGDIVVAGSFDNVGGVAVANVARWNGFAWSAMGSLPALPGGGARCLAVMTNGDVVAGFDEVYRWNGSAWVALGSLAHPFFSYPTTYALAVLPNGDLVAAGRDLYAGGILGTMARWNGATWLPMSGPSLPPFYGGVVSAVAVRAGGNLVAAVNSNPIGTTGNGYIHEWNGSAWTQLATLSSPSSPSGTATLLVLANGDVAVAGSFTDLNGAPMGNLARWNGTSWSAFGTGTDTGVSALLELPTGELLVSGGFTLANGVPASYIASWNGNSFSPLGDSSPLRGAGPMALSGSGTLFVGSSGYPSPWPWQRVSLGIARWGCAASVATKTTFGQSCYRRAAAYYEQFPAAMFDLSNATLTMTKTAVGYDVAFSAGAPAMHAVNSPDLGLGDDTVSAPISLPFSIPYPGGTTSQIVVGSNGCVFPSTPLASNPFYDDVPGFLNDVPRWAALWGDLDPGTGAGSGTIHCDVDNVNQVVYVTWQGVAEYGQPTSLSTFQVALFGNGNVEYRYLTCASSTVPALTGWSPGGGATDPGSLDLSTWGPFSTTNAAFSLPLLHRALARPALGTTCTLETTQIPANSLLGLTILGFTPYQPGIELSTVGMPGCYLHTSLDVLQVFSPAGGVGSNSFGIPSNTALIGFHLYSQGTAWVPGVNSFGGYGMISSNAIDLRIGTW